MPLHSFLSQNKIACLKNSYIILNLYTYTCIISCNNESKSLAVSSYLVYAISFHYIFASYLFQLLTDVLICICLKSYEYYHLNPPLTNVFIIMRTKILIYVLYI